MLLLLLLLALAVALTCGRNAPKSREPERGKPSPTTPNGWELVALVALGFAPIAGIPTNNNPQRKGTRRPRDGL